MPPPTTITTDIQKSSGDFLSTQPVKDETKSEIISDVEVKESSVTRPKKKKKSNEPKVKSEKKSNVLSTFFRPSEQISKAPALDLPLVERELSPNNPLRSPHRHDSDPLHIPSVDLPKPDLPLPTYDRPEVDLTTGQTKQSSEFSIPVVSFPPIPNLPFPENTNQFTQTNIDHMKVPHVQLPNLQFSSTNQEQVKLPEIPTKIKTTHVKQEEIPVQPTIETGLALSSPIDDMLSIQTDHKNFPIETDYAIKTETLVLTKPIIDTHLVHSSEVSTSITVCFILPSSTSINLVFFIETIRSRISTTFS